MSRRPRVAEEDQAIIHGAYRTITWLLATAAPMDNAPQRSRAGATAL